MNNISRIMKNIDSSSLVLLDELGAATDPTEGSALARAILNYLVEKQTLAMITTHYAEVKLMAHSSEKIQNASFNFDPNTMMPTYHLSLGTPGGSNAIATAEHFGLPAEIISDARGMLSGDVVKMEALITSLQDEKQKFETLNHDLQIQQTRLEKHNKELEKELDTLKREKKMAIQQIRDDLVREIADVERELKDASSELKKTRSMENVIIARRASQRARTKLNEALRSESDNEEYSEQGEIKIGDIVHLNDYDIDAEVIGINKATGMIDVAKGLVKFNVSELSVKRVLTKTGVTKTPTVKINRPKDRVPLELDLRGKRADEVETLVDNYLNDAAMSNVQRVRIITGYGMGVVKSIVTEMLKTHPLVASFKDAERDEGGGGATNVTLK
jgi:DNA mismatch repair protein MutS2